MSLLDLGALLLLMWIAYAILRGSFRRVQTFKS
jgi:hypothetical protein